MEIRQLFAECKEKVYSRVHSGEVISDSILARGVEEAARFNFENTKSAGKFLVRF